LLVALSGTGALLLPLEFDLGEAALNPHHDDGASHGPGEKYRDAEKIRPGEDRQGHEPDRGDSHPAADPAPIDIRESFPAYGR